MEKKIFYLDASPRYNHGCSDFAILEDNQDGTCTVIEVMSCHNCWQVGHDQDHEYYRIGDILSTQEVLEHPDLVWDDEVTTNQRGGHYANSQR
jgi:hypothetical protein